MNTEHTKIAIEIVDENTDKEVFEFDGDIYKALQYLRQSGFDKFACILEDEREDSEDLEDEELVFELDNLVFTAELY